MTTDQELLGAINHEFELAAKRLCSELGLAEVHQEHATNVVCNTAMLIFTSWWNAAERHGHDPGAHVAFMYKRKRQLILNCLRSHLASVAVLAEDGEGECLRH